MAFTKEQKTKMLAQYEDWLKRSQAVFMIQYSKMTVKDIEAFRANVRQAGGEAHVVKNTLMKIAMENSGIKFDADLEKTTLAGFAYSDAPALAKVFTDAAKNAEVFALKGGILNGQMINAAQIKMLADLPPLPVMRSRVLGVLQAPASQLVRTLIEPARQMAAVLKAYSDQAAAPAA